MARRRRPSSARHWRRPWPRPEHSPWARRRGLACPASCVENGIATIVASGKAAGILTGDAKLARRYLELGARFVAVGVDVSLLAQATRRLAADFGRGQDGPGGDRAGY